MVIEQQAKAKNVFLLILLNEDNIFSSIITISIFIINKFLIHYYRCVFFYLPNLKFTINPQLLMFMKY